jgi:hypothetical protein
MVINKAMKEENGVISRKCNENNESEIWLGWRKKEISEKSVSGSESEMLKI